MAPQELDPKQTDALAKKKVDLEKTLGEQFIRGAINRARTRAH
jgi:hypothetical protein